MQIPQSGGAGASHHGNEPVCVGARVHVRRQRWRVTEVRSYDSCELLTLLGIGAANAGRVQRVITPFEDVQPVGVRPAIRIVGERTWWRRCRDLVVNEGTSATLGSAPSARMDLLPYQLEPALAIVQGRGARALIADEVGLGKTVQAGLVAAELLARGAIQKVLVLTPAGLCDQWAAELADRFRLSSAVFGMREVRRRKAALPPGVNPWATEAVVIASIDYVKRPEVLRAVGACPWDLVVADEVHGAAPGTERLSALVELCGTAPYVVLLTATPHSGDPHAFASLCAVGRRQDGLLVFRRTRADAGVHRERRVHHLLVRPTEAEQRMHAELAAFTRTVRAERTDHSRDVWLGLVTLHKRAFSSAYALEQTLRRRLTECGADAHSLFEQLPLPLQGTADELDEADDAPLVAAMLRDPRQEREWLERLVALAHAAADLETKLRAVRRLIGRLSEPAIVFTEYRDTLLRLRSAVSPDAPVVHGGLRRDERRAAIRRFADGAAVLFATDAAGEGLNLHHASRVVINVELPWNPMRLEQRIGRVDRIGQTRRVHAFHLIAAQTTEVRLLERLRARVALAQTLVGAPNPLAPIDSLTEPTLEWLAVTGHERTPPLEPASPTESAELPDIEIVRLQGPAAAEHARLSAARSIGADSSSNSTSTQPADGPLLLRSRRQRLGRLIGSRILVVHQSVFTDSVGRIVASRLLPVLVPLQRSAARPSKAEIHGLLPALGAAHLEALDSGFSAWVEDTRRFHHAFGQCRLAREHAIVRALGRRPSLAVQRGLFESRAEQYCAADRDRHADLLRAVEARIASVHRASIGLQAPQPVLVAVR